MLRSTVRIKSHQFAPIEQCSIFCARPRDFAAARLRLQAKLGLFHCFRPKRIIENFSPNQWVLLSFISFLFLHFFRCFSGENGSFVHQIVQFLRTWCSTHFVSYFEIQILHVSKFFNHFRGNSNLQKMRKRKKEERREPQTKQRTKNEKPMRSFFLNTSAILFSSVLVHLCVVNSTINEWSDPWWSARRVAKSRREENFVNTPACFVNTFSLEFARSRAASHPSLAYIVNQA